MNALCWSAGLDSTVLLAMMIERDEEFTIIQFRDHWTKKQRNRADKFIKEHNLKVFCYPSSFITILGNNNEKSVVFDMPITGGTIPLVRDLVDADRCLAELASPTIPVAPMEFDTYFVGTRREDKHYALPPFEAGEWKVGRATFKAPLFDLTREEVLALSAHYGIEPASEDEDTGSLHLCHECIKKAEGEVFCPQKSGMIPAMGGNVALNLTEFKKRFITIV